MISVIDSLPKRYRLVLADIVGRRDPELLARLHRRPEPSPDERQAVEKHLAEALASEYVGPDYEPTERGVEIDHALDAFLGRWPIKLE